MEHKTQLVLKAIMLPLMLLVINSCNSRKENFEELSIKVAEKDINRYCSQMKELGYPNSDIFVQILDNNVFLNQLADGNLMKRYEEAFQENGDLFSKKNITFFESQLTERHSNNFLNKIKDKSCFTTKPLKKDEIEIMGWPDFRNYSLSRIVFTKDYKYAIFLSRSSGESLNIFIKKDNDYIPFRSMRLSIY